MRALANTAAGRLELLDWPMPQPGPGQVRIRTAACGICATDLEMIAGWERTGFPSIPGHEWSGVVDAVGPGEDAALVGKHCVAENVCTDGGEVGFEHPGGYGEYLLAEARNLRLLPEAFPLSLAALVEPLAVCVRAVRRLRVEDRSSALVFGDGTIGLLILALLRRARVERIAVVGGRSFRLGLARELGAEKAYDYRQEGLAETLRRSGYANIVEASGSAQALSTAFEVAGHGAHLLVLGDYAAARAAFAWNDLLHRELELVGSNASAGGWDEAVRLALSGDLPLAKFITHRFPVERYEEAFALARNPQAAALRVVLEWEL
jgi:threonine dehydrogenase-like Zn-dependent dehydrogenase